MKLLLTILSISIFNFAFGQSRNTVGLICRLGKAQYYRHNVGWKNFTAIELAANSKIRMQPGTEIEVYELVPSKTDPSKNQPERWYVRKWQSLRDTAIATQGLLNGFNNLTSPNESITGLLKQIFSELFSRDPPDMQMGSQGGTSRGLNCPNVTLVSDDSESNFVSDTLHLSWLSPKEPVKTYFVTFYSDNRISSTIWKQTEISDTIAHIKIPLSDFKPGEVYYWAVSTKLGLVCKRYSFRLLTSDEKKELDATWNSFIKKYSYPEPLQQIIKAEYYAANGLFYEANSIYKRFDNKPNLLQPEVLIMRRRFFDHMGMK
ncbi:hypothetical protein [Spirosoma radiotolerans]|uniref:Fibronectin type-III domain-containing protein n=1 Tax=Spirosoma radiotolerans TaxID=1379870 RepID=A0A0E3V8Q3_9BACT|nr:hypothetical protein [Spirosoma radiotolerans]AKD56972.1 hypothetical protein SD10_20775 [Spirosoma radiotolerans]